MDLANMRANGVRSVEARCEACGHEALANCDGLPVPNVALKLRCSACGSKKIGTKPNWTERPKVV
jgi:hypothetical protein